MKTRTSLSVLTIILLVLIMCFPCCKDNNSDDNPSYSISLKESTEVTETSFVANWITNATGIKSGTIELSFDETFLDLEKTININDPGKGSQLVEDLHGATIYFFRIILNMDDGQSLKSESGRTTTSYVDEATVLTTEDGLSITCRVKYLSSNTGQRPAIIFMHQFMCLGNFWNGADVTDNCIAEGWVCLVMNFRGHFGSSSWTLPTTLEEMFDYQTALDYDLMAAIDYLKSNPNVDGSRIALVGASLGACMSLEGNCREEVITSVALTPSLVVPWTLCPGTPLKSVFYLVGEMNKNELIDYYKDTQTLYNNTQEPKKLYVASQSRDHGWDLLNDETNHMVVDWLKARFSE